MESERVRSTQFGEGGRVSDFFVRCRRTYVLKNITASLSAKSKKWNKPTKL